MKLAIIDIVFIVLILIMVFRCALRGFVKEIMSMASLVLGFLTAVLFYKPGAAFVRTKILADMQVLPELIAFAALFAIVFFAIKLLERIIYDIISRINLGGLDQALGFVLGLLEGLLLVCVILFIINIQPLFNPESLLVNSFFAKLLSSLVGELRLPVPDLPEVLGV
ncbi:CvpA family protein [Treponema primitia ZAS-2]|uniref:CvpA family protein n=1 Tax=Treponema primitia (strain ATCC BAA-887 / DSM 12427 / ZAS-2) TaxID=545694 RepID=F5YII1_TREPZ|nr:CvpA family protein [Treponema primitia]AEF85883.1 CvpA family protein [Treponema primitia ZAS-2]